MIRYLLAAFPLLILPLSVAKADLIVTFGSSSLSPGGLSTIDVYLSGNGTDQLGRFSAQFEIERISGTGALEFQASQSASERTATNPDYVFLNKLDTGFVAFRDPINRSRLTQGDRATENVVVGNEPRLLARLELQHIVPLEVNEDAEYRIRLIENPAFTYFRLQDNLSSAAFNNQSYTNFGTISVVAVPEPGTMALGMLVLGCLTRLRNRRRVRGM